MHLKVLFLCVSLLPVISAVFTQAGIRALVDGHNAFRSQIAKGQYYQKNGRFPTAANMRKMVWDAGIAAGAQRFANTRPTWHDGNRGPVGENLYWMWDMGPTSSDSHAPRAIKMWGDEFKTIGMVGIRTGSGVGANGHATQMAWAKSYRLGCGVSNWRDGKIYQNLCSGAPASQCPAGTRPERQSGLCA
ncbi:unnamed protein product [Caenorhabditis angaria]|uniref:SCP domain-containing protein n=1 Tax=Caenorhabditis angaria TaxID=860376 RepID=A0A9P1ILG6_9PELO|nr:unnamed protein product [Caenorhabditis angaria]